MIYIFILRFNLSFELIKKSDQTMVLGMTKLVKKRFCIKIRVSYNSSDIVLNQPKDYISSHTSQVDINLFTPTMLLFSGLPSETLVTTTPPPHSSRPPPKATHPGLDNVQIQNHSLLSPTLAANITRSIPGVLEQVDGTTKPTTVTASSPPKSTFITSTSKTLTAESTKIASTLETSTVKQSISSHESTRASGTLKPTANPTKPVITVLREYVENVPQNSQKTLFVRRKHKEPIKTGRDTETSLRRNLTEAFSAESSSHHIKNHSRVSGTVKSAVKIFKSKVKMHRSTRRPELSKIVGTIMKHNKTKKMDAVSLSRKRPITMGIPASSTVLLTQKTSSTPAPTVEVYNSQESDEYYTSYGDYIDIPAVGYNSSGNYIKQCFSHNIVFYTPSLFALFCIFSNEIILVSV